MAKFLKTSVAASVKHTLEDDTLNQQVLATCHS